MNKNQSIGTSSPSGPTALRANTTRDGRSEVFTERFAIRSIDMGERYKRLGDWLLLHRYQISVISPDDMLRECGMYPHDCAGFAKKLGFSGWKEMKASLHNETVERLVYLDTEEGLAEAARRLYRHTKRTKVQFGCPSCGSDHVFRAKGGWYLYINTGMSEPKVDYCPKCGHKLLARDKKLER